VNIEASGSRKGTEFLNYLGDCWLLSETSAPWTMQVSVTQYQYMTYKDVKSLAVYVIQMCMILDCTELVIQNFEIGDKIRLAVVAQI
jgi:hypothetical protein